MENLFKNHGITEKDIAAQRAIDEKAREEAWDKLRHSLECELEDSVKAADTTDALRDMYALFDEDTSEWYYGLYDAECGGFYYANSSRDNPQFLPDLESTYQAFGFIATMTEDRNLKAYLPLWMQERLVQWVRGLQRENGFFYHPQWKTEDTDAHPPRRGRDLSHATGLLRQFGGEPKYLTPVSAKKDSEERFVPEHFSTKEKLLEYISSLDINGKPYSVGNNLESQATQFVARDGDLEKMGADYRVTDIIYDWLCKAQNPRTGLWTPYDEIDYEGTNGLLKVSGAICRMNKPVPNVLAALRSAKIGITELGHSTQVCGVMNPWYTITNLTANVRRFGLSGSTLEAERAVKAFRWELLSDMPHLIRHTTAEMRRFRKVDGSFSYNEARTVTCSQGMPVSLGLNEGDVNATHVMRSTVGHVMGVIGKGTVPSVGLSDLMRFISVAEAAKK